MVEYDPEIIDELADDLYIRGNRIILIWTLLAGAVGLTGGLLLAWPFLGSAILAGALGSEDRSAIGVGIALPIVGLVLGLLIGGSVGKSRSLELFVKAQMALCYKKIEENTRPSGQQTTKQS